ncbi:MAG: polysaccharide biosynthesis tyrosine autokinase [Paludibacter sp.]|nr:polysaccharide biosynthesis tyrosine autokinase [Paludibacter sp.]
MDNNKPNISNPNSFSVRDLFFKYRSKWYWFAISAVACFGMATLYLCVANKKYKVEATILLRQDNSGPALLDKSLIDLGMGVTNKDVEDEIQVLSSQTIIRKVILDLNIQTEYFQKEGWRYVELYPTIPVQLLVPAQFNDTAKYLAVFKIDRSEKGYTVRFKYDAISGEYQLASLSEPVRTPIGEFRFKQIQPLKGGTTYKTVSYPTRHLIEYYCENIKVSAVLKRSNAISISTHSACVKKGQAFLNKLIELYNKHEVDDKNALAKVTAYFIDERLKLIGGELQKVEAELKKNSSNVDLLRQQKVKQTLYLFVLQKREENELSMATVIPTSKPIDNAYVSIDPVSPKVLLVLLLAFVLSFGIPGLIFYLKNKLNDKIVDKAELQKLLKVPYLGSIAKNKDADKIVMADGKNTPVAEMFRSIRTHLQFTLGGAKSPVILVTSTIAGEGKTFTATNMALSFAMMKKKVVLVDLDLRNPMVDEYLHLTKDKGMSLFLSDSTNDLSDIIVPSGIHSCLSIIPAGSLLSNPDELLMSARLDDLIGKLKAEFDYIILDSAPVGVVSDTYLLNRLVDNCIYVVRQDFTPREACSLINEIYAANKFNKMSVVLNGTDERIGYGMI